MKRRVTARAERGGGQVEFKNHKWWIRRSASEGNGPRRRWREGPYATRDEAEAACAKATLSYHAARPMGEWLDGWVEKEARRALLENLVRRLFADAPAVIARLNFDETKRAVVAALIDALRSREAEHQVLVVDALIAGCRSVRRVGDDAAGFGTDRRPDQGICRPPRRSPPQRHICRTTPVS